MADNNNPYPTYPVGPSQNLTEADLKTLASRKAQKPVATPPAPPGKKPGIKLEEAKKFKPQKKVQKLLRYYNSELLIPVNKNSIIPGNCYAFSYSNYKRCPTPIIFYIGTNPRFGTLEGINLQYLSSGERHRLFKFFRKTELHSPKMLQGSQKIRNLLGEWRHIFRRSYTSDSMYQWIRKKMKGQIIFYRRYKMTKISSRIYVIPIEALERCLEINTPIKPINPLKLESHKKKFGAIINQLSQFKH